MPRVVRFLFCQITGSVWPGSREQVIGNILNAFSEGQLQAVNNWNRFLDKTRKQQEENNRCWEIRTNLVTKLRRMLSGQKKTCCPAQNKMKKNRCLFCIFTFPSTVRIAGREGTGTRNRRTGNLAASEAL